MTAEAEVVDLDTHILVTFDRIGRTGSPPKIHPPLLVETTDPDRIEERIVAYAWPYLQSEDVSVTVDLYAGTGTIHAGIQTAGRFTFEHVSPEVWL